MYGGWYDTGAEGSVYSSGRVVEEVWIWSVYTGYLYGKKEERYGEYKRDNRPACKVGGFEEVEGRGSKCASGVFKL